MDRTSKTTDLWTSGGDTLAFRSRSQLLLLVGTLLALSCAEDQLPNAVNAGQEDASGQDVSARDGAVGDVEDEDGGGVEQPASCLEIFEADPTAPNGTFQLQVESGTVDVYCDIQAGGWTRIVNLDVQTDPCPGEWATHKENANGWDVCVGGNSDCSGSALAAYFQPPLDLYRKVRGFLIGVQGFATDGFGSSFEGGAIDGPYVDGVSITVGSPRTHVWTLAAGLRRDFAGRQSCPCMDGVSPPSFVGDDYFCDSGNPTQAWERMWYTDDPLWDDGDCGNPSDDRWFEAVLDTPTSEPLEVRLLADSCDDDFGILEMELYVR